MEMPVASAGMSCFDAVDRQRPSGRSGARIEREGVVAGGAGQRDEQARVNGICRRS